MSPDNVVTIYVAPGVKVTGIAKSKELYRKLAEANLTVLLAKMRK